MKYFKTLFFLFLNLISSNQSYAHGFGAQIFVKTISRGAEGWQTIEQIYNYEIDRIKVRSYHPKSLNRAYKPIKLAGISKTNCYMRLWFDNHPTHAIICTPSQEFYVTGVGWLAACQLRTGQRLFRENQDGKGQDIAITKIEFIKKSCPVYIIEVDDYHTFLVGSQSILTHNMPLGLELFFGISVAFGEGAVAGGYAGSFFGPVTIGAGACILGLVGVGAYLLSGSNKPSYRLDFNENLIEQLVNYNDNLGKPKSSSGENGTNLSSGSGDKDPNDGDDKQGELGTIEHVLKHATKGRKTKGRAKQFEKLSGDKGTMENDFYNLKPANIHDTPTGKAGVLKNGTKINFRTRSSDGRPTLEIGNIKIRYGMVG